MNAAAEVFNVPELLEYILLSLPCQNTNSEVAAMRTVILGQTTCRTWHNLIQKSSPIRKLLYRSTPSDKLEAQTWNDKHTFPPARPNSWIPFLLLEQRSWGSAYPFDEVVYTNLNLRPSQPRYWTFSFEISKRQYDHLPKSGPWREMLASSPPFTDFWYTRCIYELGSGRAPFVSHLDYDPKLLKSERRYHQRRPKGVTLGDLVDAVCELFEKHSQTKFVMVESVRVPKDDGGKMEFSEDRPTTKSYIPGISAERAHGWSRQL